MNSLYWSLRRELWENKSIYLAPLATAGIVLFGFFLALAKLPARLRDASPANAHQIIETPFVVGAIMLMAVQMLVSIFYCLDALYGERRDRSILFWKSMPVSDLTTVLAKAIVPVAIIPLLTWTLTVATQGIMLMLGPSVVGEHLSLPQIAWYNFGHLVAFHGLWYAPFYAWLLFVSAWATRVPILWAALPPIALGIVERIALGTRVVPAFLNYVFMGGEPSTSTGVAGMTMEGMMPPPDFVIRPGLWIGLAVTAALLFGAVRLRRSRGVI